MWDWNVHWNVREREGVGVVMAPVCLGKQRELNRGSLTVEPPRFQSCFCAVFVVLPFGY